MIEPAIQQLHGLRDGTKSTWEWASKFLREDGGRRNELAEQAARDHRGRAEDLLDEFKARGDARRLKSTLRDCRNHAEHWERQFRQWASVEEHDHSYAAHVHGDAANRYRACLDALEGMDLTIGPSDTPAASSLKFIWGTSGGSSGKYIETVTATCGYSTSTELRGELDAKVWAKAGASGDMLIGKYNVEAGAELRALMAEADQWSYTESQQRTCSLDIDLSKPCFIYQILTIVPLETGAKLRIGGGLFISSRKLHHG